MRVYRQAKGEFTRLQTASVTANNSKVDTPIVIKPFRLLDLPAEIRVRFYAKYFEDLVLCWDMKGLDREVTTNVNLLFICKSIYRECHPILLTTACFDAEELLPSSCLYPDMTIPASVQTAIMPSVRQIMVEPCRQRGLVDVISQMTNLRKLVLQCSYMVYHIHPRNGDISKAIDAKGKLTDATIKRIVGCPNLLANYDPDGVGFYPDHDKLLRYWRSLRTPSFALLLESEIIIHNKDSNDVEFWAFWVSNCQTWPRPSS